MLQYGSYPIYVVYSRRTQEALYDVAIDYLNEGNKETYMHMTDTGISRLEIQEDADPVHTDEVVNFENTIKRQLDKIATSMVGKAILNSLYPAARIFIIPFAFNKDVAQTGWSRTVGEGNGMHIRINPDDWSGADNLDDARKIVDRLRVVATECKDARALAVLEEQRAQAAASASPKPSGSASPNPSGTASPTAEASATSEPSASPSASGEPSADASGSPSPDATLPPSIGEPVSDACGGAQTP